MAYDFSSLDEQDVKLKQKYDFSTLDGADPGAVQAANYVASFNDPKSEANKAELSRRIKATLGEDIAPGIIDPVEAQRRLRVVENDHVLRASPALAQKYLDTGFASRTFDDVPKLGQVEKAAEAVKQVGLALVGNIGASMYGLSSAGAGLMRAASENLTGADSAPSQYFAEQQRSAEYWRKTGQNLGGDLSTMPVMGPVYSGVQSAWQSMLMMPMAMMTGNPMVALAPMGLTTAGQSYGQARDEKNASPLKALGFATTQGVAEAATEAMPLGRFIKDVKVGAPMWQILRNQLITENLTEQAATVWQDFNEWAMLNPDKSFQSFIDERPGAALDTLIATTTATLLQTGMVQGAMRSQIRQNRAIQAEQGAQALEYLNKSIGETELSKRDRGTLQEFLQAAALDENGQEQTVRISAAAFENVLNQAGLDPDAVLQTLPSAAEQYAVAKEVGGDLVIPMSEIASQTFGSDVGNALLPHIAIGEDGMSLAEAQDFQKTQAEEFRKQAEIVMAEKERDDAFVTSAQEVEKAVMDQLTTANRFTSDVNRAYATLTRDFFVTTAARMGVTPGELWKQYGLGVVAEGQGQLNQNTAQLDTPEFKNWFGDSKVVDADGKPLVVYHGTGAAFDSFSPDKIGSGQGFDSEGFFFTSGKDDAQLYADLVPGTFGETREGVVMPVYLSMRNPLRITRENAAALGLDTEFDEGTLYDNNRNTILRLAKEGGHDGVISTYLFDNEDLAAGQTHYVAFSPTQIKSAIGNNGEFNPNDPNILNQENRGGFNPDSLTVILNKSADLSTFLHESAHFYLTVLTRLAGQPNAPADIQQDVEKTLAWFGIQGTPQVSALQFWNNLTLDEQRPYHEKWAESFEAYLFEGKAPSIELQATFARFKTWMIRVYKSLKDFLAGHPTAELHPEVIAIFDRLLATEEQIKLAEQARSMMPLFESEQQSGMTPGEWAAYQELKREPTDEAKAQLAAAGVRDLTWLRRLTAKVTKKFNAEAKALREQEMIEARREVMAQPLYQAWQYLTGKGDKAEQDAREKRLATTGVDERVDSLLTAIAKLGGIQRDSAKEHLGVHQDDFNHRVGIKPVFRAEGGRTADEMAGALAEYGYLAMNEHGQWDLRELEDKVQEEIGGNAHYSSNADVQYVLTGNTDKVNPDRYGKLNLGDLREMGLPVEIVERLQKLRMTGVTGISPDVVAEQFGFGSGDELVRTLAAANTPKEAIEALTDQRMLENHGELASPEAIAQAVDAAIHNEARARLVATEMRFLSKVKTPVRVLTNAAKDYANQILGRKRVRDLTAAPFMSAASKAANNARQAMQDGKTDIAVAELRNQLLNTTAANRAISARLEVEKALKYLKKFSHGNSRKSIDSDFMDQIDKLLERFDLRPASGKTIDKRTALAEWLKEQEANGIEPDLDPILMAEANRTHYKNLTLDEFRGLVDAIRQIEHLGRLKNRLLTARDKRLFADVVKTIRDSIDANNVKGRQANNAERDTWQSKLGGWWKGAMASHRKVASMVRELDGFKDGGPLWEYYLRGMNEAGDHEATMREKATVKLMELLAPVKAQGRMGGKGLHIPEIGRALNRGERLAVALNTGNDGNLQRLMDGYKWNAAQVNAILATLTREDLAFVQNVWDFIESYRPEVAKLERDVTGVEPKWVVAVPRTVKLADGTEVQLRGGYYPVKYDPRQSVKAGEHAEAETSKALTRAAYTSATTRHSFTKARADKVVDRPILLSLDVMLTGTTEVIHDLAWRRWLIDSNRLLRAVGQDINDIYGTEWVQQFKASMKDIAQGDQPAANTVEKSLNHLRTGATVAGLGWNLMTSLLQPLGLTQSMVRIGPTWVARGLKTYLADPMNAMDKISAKSEFMRVRAKTMQREINEIQNQIADKSKVRTMAEASFFYLIQKVQLVADIPTWLGAYEKSMAQSTDEARAVALADQAVIDSQGGGQIKDLAQVQRGTAAFKLFTNFYSFFNVALQLGVERTRQTNFKNPMEVLRLGGDYLMLYTVPAVLGAILKDVIKGDGDDEDLMRKLIAEQISYLLGLFVGLREVTAMAQSALDVQQFNTAYAGPAGLRFFQELDKMSRQDMDSDSWRKSAINVGGILFHLPSGQVNRTIDGTAALIEGRTSNPLAPMVGAPR